MYSSCAVSLMLLSSALADVPPVSSSCAVVKQSLVDARCCDSFDSTEWTVDMSSVCPTIPHASNSSCAQLRQAFVDAQCCDSPDSTNASVDVGEVCRSTSTTYLVLGGMDIFYGMLPPQFQYVRKIRQVGIVDEHMRITHVHGHGATYNERGDAVSSGKFWTFTENPEIVHDREPMNLLTDAMLATDAFNMSAPERMLLHLQGQQGGGDSTWVRNQYARGSKRRMYDFANFPELIGVFGLTGAGTTTFTDFTDEQTFFYRVLPNGKYEVRMFLRYTVDLIPSGNNPFDSMFGIGVTEGPSSQGYPITIRPLSVPGFDPTQWYGGWGEDSASQLCLARWRVYTDLEGLSSLESVSGMRMDLSSSQPPVYTPQVLDMSAWESATM